MKLMPPRNKKIPTARTPPNVPEAWSAEEVGRILLAASQSPGMIGGVPAALWWKSLLLVFYDTGERRGAVLATETADIDPEAGYVVFRFRKGGIPRCCPLSQETVEACRRIHEPTRLLMWPFDRSPDALDDRFAVILRRANVPFGRKRGGVFHKLRKTAGTLAESNGGHGHKLIGCTRKVFEKHYRDPRFFGRGQLDLLPRPGQRGTVAHAIPRLPPPAAFVEGGG